MKSLLELAKLPLAFVLAVLYFASRASAHPHPEGGLLSDTGLFHLAGGADYFFAIVAGAVIVWMLQSNKSSQK